MPITAALVIVGAAAVPAKSPANWIFPAARFVASGVPAAAAASTYAVVATAVELLLGVWVVATVPLGSVTVPVKVGEANGALRFKAV